MMRRSRSISVTRRKVRIQAIATFEKFFEGGDCLDSNFPPGNRDGPAAAHHLHSVGLGGGDLRSVGDSRAFPAPAGWGDRGNLFQSERSRVLHRSDAAFLPGIHADIEKRLGEGALDWWNASHEPGAVHDRVARRLRHAGNYGRDLLVAFWNPGKKAFPNCRQRPYRGHYAGCGRRTVDGPHGRRDRIRRYAATGKGLRVVPAAKIPGAESD